jgi:hypothetical protein
MDARLEREEEVKDKSGSALSMYPGVYKMGMVG